MSVPIATSVYVATQAVERKYISQELRHHSLFFLDTAWNLLGAEVMGSLEEHLP